MSAVQVLDAVLFLSTPSARRATVRCLRGSVRLSNFYPRPPRGGRPVETYLDANSWDISIHALREEGDGRGDPRHPVKAISIHALREEGDHCRFCVLHQLMQISIHALREEGDIA